jgi:hypothetical protein
MIPAGYVPDIEEVREMMDRMMAESVAMKQSWEDLKGKLAADRSQQVRFLETIAARCDEAITSARLVDLCSALTDIRASIRSLVADLK